MQFEDICALSTAAGVGGVAVIRLSGKSVFSKCEKIFTPKGKTPVRDFEPYKLYVGEIDCGSFKDFCMCVKFYAPKSYTGEDMVEFHTHGGVAIVNGVLNKLVDLGCKPAGRGEFTKRAFLNGKLSLSSAEGLIDMINSESEGEVKAGYSLYTEKLKNKIEKEQADLEDVLTFIDAGIDYPDEVDEPIFISEIKEKLTAIKDFLEETSATFFVGEKVKTGVSVAIVGKTNVGKSSLLNALINCDKAIVTDVAGTTRDVVYGEITIDGIKFNLYDTAGIRETVDKVESIGIEKSKKAVLSSDVVLLVYDGSEKEISEDKELSSLLKDKKVITVVNKSDALISDIKADIYVSAKTGDNLEKLKRLLYDTAIGKSVDLFSDALIEKRHYDAVKRALIPITRAIENIENIPVEIVAQDVKETWDILGEITGKTATEEIIDGIFSKFCVGK